LKDIIECFIVTCLRHQLHPTVTCHVKVTRRLYRLRLLCWSLLMMHCQIIFSIQNILFLSNIFGLKLMYEVLHVKDL